MVHELHPYKMTVSEWDNIQKDIVSRYGIKYLISSVLKRDMGWSPRSVMRPGEYHVVYMDFWDPEARTAFLLEYSDRDFG